MELQGKKNKYRGRLSSWSAPVKQDIMMGCRTKYKCAAPFVFANSLFLYCQELYHVNKQARKAPTLRSIISATIQS